MNKWEEWEAQWPTYPTDTVPLRTGKVVMQGDGKFWKAAAF
jgi:hypothetical protein